MKPKIAVIGGGISGLTAAFCLTKNNASAEVTLFEATDRLGGVLDTIEKDGFLFERSADNFIANEGAPWALDLCEEIGFRDQLIQTNTEHRRALIWSRGRLHPVPEGFQLMKPSNMWAIARSPLLSIRAKLRMAMERFVKDPKGGPDESLATFSKRRLGEEAFERLVQPLVSGIFTADANKLSMQAALPQFVKMVETHGSLIAAARKQKNGDSSSGARYGQFYAPKQGMASLIGHLAGKLVNTDINLSCPISSIRREGNSWFLNTEENELEFNAVVIALPASRCSTLVKDVSIDLSNQLSSIEHASSSVVCLGYRNEQFRKPLNAFGIVIPEVEDRPSLAVSFSSMKFPNRAPHGFQLLRVFVGGALRPEIAKLPDDELVELATKEMEILLGAKGGPEVIGPIVRWSSTMPQYHIGHRDKVRQIREITKTVRGLEIISNGLDGVGVPQCVKRGMDAANKIEKDLSQ